MLQCNPPDLMLFPGTSDC